MDAVLFLDEYSRMCKAMKCCDVCPFGDKDECGVEYDNHKKAVEIVEKWSREHPAKTMMDDFFEKFPNAPKEPDGTPNVCPEVLGYEKEQIGKCERECVECWSRPLEVKE